MFFGNNATYSFPEAQTKQSRYDKFFLKKEGNLDLNA